MRSRFPWVVVVAACSAASTATSSARTTSACEQAVIDEAEQVHARVHALAARVATGTTLDATARASMRAAILEVTIDVPMMYVAEKPQRFAELLDAKDALATGAHDTEALATIARVLHELDAEYSSVLMSRPLFWVTRCSMDSDWNQRMPSLSASEIATRGAMKQWLLPAFARADACAALEQRVSNTPERGREQFRAEIDVCERDLSAAHGRCERELAPLVRRGMVDLERAGYAVLRFHEMRRPSITPDEVVALTAVITPVLDAMQPPRSELPAAVRTRRALLAAKTAKDPRATLDDVGGGIRDLGTPCGALYPRSSSRCLISPASCRLQPD